MGEQAKASDLEEVSDVAVICGDTEWDLHQSILRDASTHFRDILADSKIKSPIYLQSFKDPVKFQWLVTYIYSKEVEPDLAQLLAKPKTITRACVDVLFMATRFGVESFQDIIHKPLRRLFSIEAVKFQIHLHCFIMDKGKISDCPAHDDHFTNKFFFLARLVYTNESFRRTRRIFVQYFSFTLYQALRTDRYRREIEVTPGFAEELLFALVDDDVNCQNGTKELNSKWHGVVSPCSSAPFLSHLV
ncbi:uncharacterized protein F4822DRAFT_446105 [Hypoxylon trugodes]|uniref:uncharacterized protein n=1 Tax=Hypoxylon trugodes TaxID=326681 RepID=UPI00218FA079|nr:uncharacterized protein F4822DRAFT_446105 [Hypoxylon trugodes]KAI1384992.1 hypothetical protein F4822DRAFT_446105 [Hypoxylon trugodes]